MWAEAPRQDRTGCVVAVAWEGSGKGCEFWLLKGRERLWDICKQMHNEMLWVDCVSPEKDICILTPGPQNMTLLRDGVLNELNEIIRMGFCSNRTVSSYKGEI